MKLLGGKKKYRECYRADSENGGGARRSSALSPAADGQAAGAEARNDHAHRVLRQEENEARVLVQHPQRQVSLVNQFLIETEAASLYAT